MHPQRSNKNQAQSLMKAFPVPAHHAVGNPDPLLGMEQGGNIPVTQNHISQIPGLHPSVNVVPSVPVGELPYKNCVPLPMAERIGTKICIHPVNEDIWISGKLAVHGLNVLYCI